MTIGQHINFLIDQANEDYGAAQALYKAGYHAHALFWAHLVLEKLCKALWVKNKKSEKYPYIHNLIRLLTDTKTIVSEEQMKFFADMNQFQSKGRYADTLHLFEKTVSKQVCEKYLNETQKQMQWLINQMQ